MSLTPITFPTYPQNQPYCQPQDVLDLLGSMTFSTQANSDTFLAKAIARAQDYIETRCARKFNVFNVTETYDGSGTVSLGLENYPIVSLTWAKNYVNQYLVSQVFSDYGLQTDRQSGIIRTPESMAGMLYAQYGFTWHKGNKNVQVSYWAGFTKDVRGEQLQTADNLTYTFANPTLAKTLDESMQFGAVVSTPPYYRPRVYVNGVELVNTQYQFVSTANGNWWQISQDNVYYSVNWSAGTITFNEAQTGTVTADYSYYYVPLDIQLAAAKFAAIEVLKIEGIGLGGKFGQGAGMRQLGDVKLQYGRNSTQPWEGTIESWQADIEQTIQSYARVAPTTTQGYSQGSGYWG